MKALVMAVMLVGCVDSPVSSWDAAIGGACDNSESSLCAHNDGWCTEGQVCRSYCSIVMPFCDDGFDAQTSHSHTRLSWTCVCVPR